MCRAGNRLIFSQTHQFPWRHHGRAGWQVDPQRNPAGSPELLWPSCIQWWTPSLCFPASDWTLDHTSETTAQWTCISTTACFRTAVLCCFSSFPLIVRFLSNHLTFSIVLKSTPVKMFPTNGIDQGPGGKLRGAQFLITSVISNTRKINKTQLLKSIYAKIFCKIMVKTLVPLHNCSLKETGVGWVLHVGEKCTSWI